MLQLGASMSFLPILSLGFVLGVTHATDADHVVAVTTLVSRQKRVAAAARIGALWGAGHTLMIVGVGALLLLTRVAMPERLAQSFELGVAAMLVGLGVVALLGRGHAHGREGEGASARAALRPFGIGVVHGLAGSAAVALAVLAEVQETALALGYFVLFGFGTMLGMALVTTAVALPFRFATARAARALPWIQRAAGLASIGVGVALAYRIGWVEGLLL